MTIPVEPFVAGAKAMKERYASEAFAAPRPPDLGDIDIPPAILFWRSGKEVAIVLAHSAEEIVKAAKIGVPAFGADAVAVLNEAVRASPAWNAEFQRAPRPGELEEVFRAGRTDLVTEALVTVVADRTGMCSQTVTPYVVDYEKRLLTWGVRGQTETVIIGDGAGIPRVLRECFDMEQVMISLHSAGVGPSSLGLALNEDDTRLALDAGVTQTLCGMGMAVRLACYSDEDAARLKLVFDLDGAIDYHGIGPGGQAVKKDWGD